MRWNLPSQTAQFVALFRALGNVKPTIPGYQDPIAERLIPSYWFLSMAVCRLKMKFFPTLSPYPYWLQKIGIMIQFRTVIFDNAIEKNLPFDQLVILGAGLDSRAWRMKQLSKVKIFEVDHPATQDWKKEKVQKIISELKAEEITFVSVDFTKDDLSKCLEQSGFHRKKRTFWLWEGVTMYLEEEDVKKTMRLIANLSEGGGNLGLTYLDKYDGKVPVSFLISALGEPFKSAYSAKELDQLAQENGGWKTIENSGLADWNQKLCPSFIPPVRRFGRNMQERIWIGKI